MTKKKPSSWGASRGNLSGSSNARDKFAPSRNAGKGVGKSARSQDYSFYEKEPATPEYLARLFAQYEFALDSRQLEQFWKYYCLLKARNAAYDLTRIMGIEATVLKHFIDCGIVARLVELPGAVLDIGSGGGFPGAPIAILRPDLQVILAESRGKRVQFLEELKKELQLVNVQVFGKSVREDSPLRAGSVVTRALEVIPATLRRIQGFINPGGRAVFMKGPNCGQEITDAQQEFKGVYKMTEDIKYSLPNSNQARRLVVFDKKAE
jgi:16S rRNA (guanine527-N7)-methyltransferase